MTCSRCGGEWCAVDEFGEQAQRAFDGCAATQLEDAREVIVTLRATMEQMRRERDEARSERDCEQSRVNSLRAALDGARETNARLHRRAQGVDARKPDDEDLIRRLRADVRGQAKHAGHVIGYVMRLRCALSDAQHAGTKAERARDEARAKLARKLARIHHVLVQLGNATPGGTMTAMDVVNEALRIIDEKEGGQ